MDLNTYINESRNANQAEQDAQYQLAVQSQEQRRIANAPWTTRAYHAIVDWLNWVPGFIFGPKMRSTAPWYAMPGGITAFNAGYPKAHPEALGWLARRRMVNSNPLVIPGDQVMRESDNLGNDTWPG